MPNSISDNRLDFVRRLFAVVVSVGFATQVSGMEWIRSGNSPTSEEVREILLLCFAVVVTIASWEGYNQYVSRMPLEDISRFILDILIVFSYLVLFLSSHNELIYLYTLTFIFFLYFLWDLLCAYIPHAEKNEAHGGSSKSAGTQSWDWHRSLFWLVVIGAGAGIRICRLTQQDQAIGANQFDASLLITVLGLILPTIVYRVDMARRLKHWTRRWVFGIVSIGLVYLANW